MTNTLKNKEITPPIAEKKPMTLEAHGHKRTDNYFWLKEKENPKVIEHLHAENSYTESKMLHTKQLQNDLFNEIQDRIKQTDKSVPYKNGNFFYYTRFEDKKEYPIFCRQKEGTTIEEILLDVNEHAKDYSYYKVGALNVSPNENILAFSIDTSGDIVYDIKFKNLKTGKIIDDTIKKVSNNFEWANDNKTLFYSGNDNITLRSDKILKHTLGTSQEEDQIVYKENDETFSVYIDKSKSKKYMLIASIKSTTTEYQYAEADNINSEFKLFNPRKNGHEYFVDHINDNFYIKTNNNAKNFKLMQTSELNTNQSFWSAINVYDPKNLLENFELFDNFIVLEERCNGLIQFKIINSQNNSSHYIKFPEDCYSAWIAENETTNSNIFRFGYTSLTTPQSIFDYDMKTKKMTLLKEKEILGGFSKDNYKTERIFANAKDGTKIPISLVYKKELRDIKNGNPTLIYGYGSYGITIDPTFSPLRLSLLERGFVFAIAHIRGGEELGRQWYDDGRLFNKINTFTDFITCSEHLIESRFADKKNLFAEGRSAGGLLMGAIINMRPDLYKGIIATVPFVDVITTMQDKSIPLTTGEFDEWGNPEQKEYYDYILKYSPYDNVKSQNYPNILISTGFYDSQVQYWEPAKWVAKLRYLKTDHNLLLFKIYMKSGHGGASGRYDIYKEVAFEYAFILDLV